MDVIKMEAIYKYPLLRNGELITKTVILSYKDRWGRRINFDELLHDVALELSVCPAWKHLDKENSGLTVQQILPYIKPEMLEPYGVTMQVLEDAEEKDCTAAVVNLDEMEQVRAICIKTLDEMKKSTQFIAKRLLREKREGHPIISTWPLEHIMSESVEWAYEFEIEYGNYIGLYTGEKIREAQPYGATEDTA